MRFALIVLLAGCGSVRVIERTSAGGSLELDGDRAKAMRQAHDEMAAHCGDANSTITFVDSSSGAYVIHYRCNGT